MNGFNSHLGSIAAKAGLSRRQVNKIIAGGVGAGALGLVGTGESQTVESARTVDGTDNTTLGGDVILARTPTDHEKSYNVADFADMGGAINQAISDGAAHIIGPSAPQEFATTIHIDSPKIRFTFPSTRYTFTGSGDAIRVNHDQIKLVGGLWRWGGEGNGAGSVNGIHLVGEGVNVNKCHFSPDSIKHFYRGVYVEGVDNGVAYNRFELPDVRTNEYGLYVAPSGETNAGHANSNAVYWGDFRANDTAGIYLSSKEGAADLTGWSFFGADFENNTCAVRTDGAVTGVNLWGVYFEGNETNVDASYPIRVVEDRGFGPMTEYYMGNVSDMALASFPDEQNLQWRAHRGFGRGFSIQDSGDETFRFYTRGKYQGLLQLWGDNAEIQINGKTVLTED